MLGWLKVLIVLVINLALEVLALALGAPAERPWSRRQTAAFAMRSRAFALRRGRCAGHLPCGGGLRQATFRYTQAGSDRCPSGQGESTFPWAVAKLVRSQCLPRRKRQVSLDRGLLGIASCGLRLFESCRRNLRGSILWGSLLSLGSACTSTLPINRGVAQ
jgi:hypothetical protein